VSLLCECSIWYAIDADAHGLLTDDYAYLKEKLGDLLFVTSGHALLPPSIVRVNPSPPYNTTVILDNFLGRQFNSESLNDIKILPGTDITSFTDPA
jgi:hypothetical protein